ncbi:hypothetical protein [Candidatus Nitrosocosmicus sp. R]
MHLTIDISLDDAYLFYEYKKTEYLQSLYEIKIARVVTFKLEPQIDSQNNVETALLLKNHFFIMWSNNTV